MLRPNIELTTEEKLAKRQLKRHLKQRIRIRKYEMRWSQACGRNDTGVATKAALELRNYLAQIQGEPDSLWYHPDFPKPYHEFFNDPNSSAVPTLLSRGVAIESDEHFTNESDTLEKSRLWMTREIWQTLVLRILPDPPTSSSSDTLERGELTVVGNECGRSAKQLQTNEARRLLNHMTKGTQTESMFENDAALIGYTRQKFMERALLTVKSLDRLRPLVRDIEGQADANGSSFPNELWQKLLQTRSILSVGCGPGCDAVGVVAFLQQQQQGDNVVAPARPILDRMILMDYVMPRWKRLVINHLIPILTQASSKKKNKNSDTAAGAAAAAVAPWVSRVDTASCDVRYSLIRDGRNAEAWKCLTTKGGGCGTSDDIDNDSTSNDNVNDNDSSCYYTVDLIVVSYLLTETRDQWMDFFRDLLQEYCCCQQQQGEKECLILLSEPSAWQLHSLTTLFADHIKGFQWLDSSRDAPDLQPLEARSGPAVVLIQTKQRDR